MPVPAIGFFKSVVYTGHITASKWLSIQHWMIPSLTEVPTATRKPLAALRSRFCAGLVLFEVVIPNRILRVGFSGFLHIPLEARQSVLFGILKIISHFFRLDKVLT